MALVNCTLDQVDKDAFSGLAILIELDLSDNHIKVIHAGTFHTLVKIRKISLHHNEIEAISDRTFENLLHLSIVELNYNRIHSVGEQAFLNIPKIKVIYLDNNRLQKLEKTAFTNMQLTELKLSDNRWNCTCELKDFRNYVVERKLSTDTKCHYPKSLKDRLWTDVTEDEFACSPQIFVPRGVKSMRASRANETIVCQVRGTPPPTVEWLFGSRLIRESDHYHIRASEKTPKASTLRDEHLKHVVSELTIIGLRASDKGRYSCKATNVGGHDEVSIQLDIPSDSLSDSGIFYESRSNNTIFMILCIIVGILFVIVFTICILCCYCRRVNKYDKKPSSDNTLLMSQQNGLTTKLNGKSQSESILDGGSVIMELQKNLLTEVNPVEKPPRRTEVDSIEKDGDDVSDLKQTLLDETTAYGECWCMKYELSTRCNLYFSPFLSSSIGPGHAEDETRSVQLSDSINIRSRHAFIEDGYSANLLPPDLLAFPRFPQSPSLQSSISNIHEPRIYARSPLTSPVYGETTLPMSGFRTLQHPKTGRTLAVATSRSNSPFVPAPILYPKPVLKQGYVTIPRKQRTGSWAPSIASDYQTSPSSPPTANSSIASATIELVEPVYDNLGLRTTAAGSSSLNLNKIPGSMKNGTLPSPGANLKYSMKDRPLPATPHMNGSLLREPLYSSATLEKKVPPRPPPKPRKKPSDTLNNTSESVGKQQIVVPIQHRITSNGKHIDEDGEDGTEV